MGGRLRAQVRAKAARHHHCAHRKCSLRQRAKCGKLLGCTRADESKIYQSHNNGGGAGSLRDSDGNRGADVCSMATPGELASEEDCTPANGECHCNLESRLVAEFREGNPEDANGAGESVDGVAAADVRERDARRGAIRSGKQRQRRGLARLKRR